MKSLLAANDKIKRKWTKIIEGKPTLMPTKIPSLDEVCEKILPSEIFVPGQKFPLGNVQWRLKLICAYIMLKNGENPDTFADEVPEDFKPTGFGLKDLEEFSNNIEASVPRKIERKKKGDEIIDLGDIDVDDSRPDVARPDVAKPDVAGPSVVRPDATRPSVARLDAARKTATVKRPSIIVNTQTKDVSRILTKPAGTRKGSVRGRPKKSSTNKEPSRASRTEPYEAPLKPVFEGMIDVVTAPVPENVVFDAHEFDLDVSRETGTPAGSDDDVPLLKRSNSKKRYRGLN